MKTPKSVLANGVLVANSLSAKPKGDSFEAAKLTSLKVTEPEVTSGTVAMVVSVPQVMTP